MKMEMFRAQSVVSVFVLLMRFRYARAEREAFEYADKSCICLRFWGERLYWAFHWSDTAAYSARLRVA